MRMRNRLYISWVGLRGAVPIVFATYPLLAGIEKADMIFNVVFFVSVTSVIVQGTTLPLLARWLHVALPERVKRREVSDMLLTERMKSSMRELTIPPKVCADGKQVVDLHFPPHAIIAMIKRGDKYITPNGNTKLRAGDRLVILSETDEGMGEVYKCLGVSEQNPQQEG